MGASIDSPWFTIPEAQAYLGGISRAKLYQLLSEENSIRVAHIGRSVRVVKASLLEFCAELEAAEVSA